MKTGQSATITMLLVAIAGASPAAAQFPIDSPLLGIIKQRVDNGRSVGSGQGAVRLWPENETDFFLKEVDAQIKFIKDASGAITSLPLTQNGRPVTAPKIQQ